MSTTFAVNDVSGKKTYYEPELDALEKGYKGIGKFEAYGGPEQVITPMTHDGVWQAPRNGLWTACQAAFLAHKRLVLKPDHIWLAIARVAAEHITSNAEQLRRKFVNFEGMKTLYVQRNDFVKGSKDNPWPEVFTVFTTEIDSNVAPDVLKVFLCNFSTSDPIDRAVSRVVLMDAMSKYFRYEFITLSGIPEITLLGEREDWCKVQEKVEGLKDFGMGLWLDKLVPFLDEFILAAGGDPDRDWWKSFYREHGGSGGPSFDGNLTVLFPKKDLTLRKVLYGQDIPQAFSRVPFIWKHHEQEFRMRFVAGVPFATMTEDGAVTPAASWAIEEV